MVIFYEPSVSICVGPRRSPAALWSAYHPSNPRATHPVPLRCACHPSGPRACHPSDLRTSACHIPRTPSSPAAPSSDPRATHPARRVPQTLLFGGFYVGFRQSLCHDPALFLSGFGGFYVGAQRFLCRPGAFCVGPALFVSGPGVLCRGPALLVRRPDADPTERPPQSAGPRRKSAEERRAPTPKLPGLAW